MRGRTTAIIVGAAMLAALPAAGQTKGATMPAAKAAPGSIETARKLVAMMKMDRTLDFVFVQLIPIMSNAVIGQLEQGANTKALMARMEQTRADARDRIVAIFAQEFSTSIRARYPAMKENAAREYAAAFSEAELQDMLAFYSSGTGAKALEVLPQLQQSLSQKDRQVGLEAGQEAGVRGIKRAIDELLPKENSDKS